MKDDNNTIICNSQGKVLYFGLNIFIDRIVNTNSCFICGDKPEDKEFNNEHVIPDWLLRKHNLYNSSITLPNGTTIPYSTYKIPCCKDCNSELGRQVEKPVSMLLSKPYKEIIEAISKDKTLVNKLFHWLCLIYIKTHLKDTLLPFDRDRRKNTGYIGEHHYWEDMHHIHCMARIHYTNALIEQRVIGSIIILPALILEDRDTFDYADHSASKTVMLQSGEFCIVAVLNDACGSLSVFNETFQKITGPLTPFQIKDVMAHMNFINLNLKQRPIFHSLLTHKREYKIIADVPDTVYLNSKEDSVASHGELLRFYVSQMIGDVEEREQILDDIELGRRNYLFNENGMFIDFSKTLSN